MLVDLVSPPQHESLVDLLVELNGYYNDGACVAREVVRSHLMQNLLAPESPIRLVTASQDGVVAGFAAITLLYSLVEPCPEKSRQCQLKELYVRSSARRRDVGKALMAWIAQYAIDSGCCRVDWPVKAENTRGISFYERLGAQQVVERLSYRLTEPALSRLARQCRSTPPGG